MKAVAKTELTNKELGCIKALLERSACPERVGLTFAKPSVAQKARSALSGAGWKRILCQGTVARSIFASSEGRNSAEGLARILNDIWGSSRAFAVSDTSERMRQNYCQTKMRQDLGQTLWSSLSVSSSFGMRREMRWDSRIKLPNGVPCRTKIKAYWTLMYRYYQSAQSRETTV